MHSGRGAAIAQKNAPEVAEFQGLYGAYHVGEILLQKIWLRGAFDQSRARTTDGESVAILHPGTWNRLSGPDFQGARLNLGGRELIGDIEVHFGVEAWKHHGHEVDPAYDRVVLHVVLYPPAAGTAPARTRDGRPIPSLALVDLLWHDLEEYAEDEAVSALSGRDALPVVEHLMGLAPGERAAAIREAAGRRWRGKVHFARLRVQRCGWEEACHLTALEILGYRANREAMLRVGTAFSGKTWFSTGTGPDGPSVEAMIAAGGTSWTGRGVRPANQPRQRLAQYRAWMTRVPDWPTRLKGWALPEIGSTEGEVAEKAVSDLRRRVRLTALRAAWQRELAGDQVGGVRFDTLVVNLVLPFLGTDPAVSTNAAAWWRLWTPGDVPDVMLEATRQLRSPDQRDVRTTATVQGLLELHLQRALAASLAAPDRSPGPFGGP